MKLDQEKSAGEVFIYFFFYCENFFSRYVCIVIKGLYNCSLSIGRSREGRGERRRKVHTTGAFHSTKYSGNSRWGSEWNRHFPEFLSEILGAPREVGLKLRKIGITGKFRSIRPFLLGPSFSESGNRTQHGCLKFSPNVSI